MFKFLHTADIHLDSPLRNLDNYDDIPRDEFRSATRRAFDNVVELAIREEVAFVLLAGDLYDGDSNNFHTPLHIRRKMEELNAAGIRVFIIQGNHDAANNMTNAFRLTLPDNVHLFATNSPETVLIDELKVAIHGQGFAEKAVTEDLSKNYPEPVQGYLNIGMLHTNCGSNGEHDPYAPSTVTGLTAKGYDYWALGHIHKPNVLTGPDPWIIYSGCPQGRHIGETEERGCVIASYDGDHISQKMHHVDVLRWYTVDTNVEDCDDADSAIAKCVREIETIAEKSDGRPLAVRLKLSGKTNAHRELARRMDYWDRQIRVAVLDRFEQRVWVEKIKFKTKPPARKSDVVDSGLDALIADLQSPQLAAFARTELRADFEKMLEQLPHDPRQEREHLDLDNDAAMALVVAEARELLVARVVDSGAEV
ncbi:MAG: exonuclease SbcCD subunit D [Planctomycetaceae bacterium]